MQSDGRRLTPRLVATLGVTLIVGLALSSSGTAREGKRLRPTHHGLVLERPPAPADTDSTAVAELRREAARLDPLYHSPMLFKFLHATARLPHVATRTILHDSSRTHFYWPSEAAALADSSRSGLIRRDLDETFYYNTRYGSPLAYVRPLQLLLTAGAPGLDRIRIADYGYGTVGHLRLLASLGGDVVGIEVDPLLHKLYSLPGDQGDVPAAEGHSGRVTLAHGHFPGDADVAAAVGEGHPRRAPRRSAAVGAPRRQ